MTKKVEPKKKTLPAKCPQCGKTAYFMPNWVEGDLEWWHCHNCNLDFSTIGQR